MTLSLVILRLMRRQRLTLNHYLYISLAAWVLVLFLRHYRQPNVTTISFLNGESEVTRLVLPTPKKIIRSEAYRYLSEVRDNLLKEFIGADMPPGIAEDDNVTKPKLGDILEPGQVRRVVLLTSWRSGSTFLGDLLNSWPGAYYHFEPFHFFGEREMVSRQMEPLATGLLRTLLTCNFDQRITPYLYYITSGRYNFLQKKNVRATPLCRGRGLCQDPGVMATACALHPLNFAKTVRLRLAAVEPLIKNKSLDLRVVHLVRDPRGVMNSRMKMPWCSGKSCSDISTVCRALNQDALVSEDFGKKYPNQYFLLRYEDLMADPYLRTRKLFDFLGLPLVEQLAVFIEEHMNTEAKKNDRGDDYAYAAHFSTYRNSSVVSTRWRTSLTNQKVQEVQSLCRPSLRYYGYRIFNSREEQTNLEIPVIEAEPGRSMTG